MKRFLKGALCFLPFVILIVGVNFYADPANVLRTGYERTVAEILAGGENASNLRNMDDRLFMEEYVSLRKEPIGTLVLGSSHSMQITKELTGDENTFCAGMTGADLRDCISAYRLFRENGFTPERVILVVDCWFLCEETQEPRAMTDGYEAFCKENGLMPVQTEAARFSLKKLTQKWSQAVSLPYFQSSLDYLKKGLQNDRDPVATDSFYTDTDMRRADGTYCYNQELRNVQEDQTHDRAVNYIIATPEFAKNFTTVSANLENQLIAFITSMQEDGVQVALMLPPFHPEYYTYMTQTELYTKILMVEPVVQQIAETCGVRLFGSFDPSKCGLSALDFYDGLHCSDQAMYRFYPENLFDL